VAKVYWFLAEQLLCIADMDEGLAQDSLLFYCPKCAQVWLKRIVCDYPGAETRYRAAYDPWCKVLPNIIWTTVRSIREIQAGFNPPELQAIDFLLNCNWELSDDYDINKLDSGPEDNADWREWLGEDTFPANPA
jgi:hypothetical protein